MGTKKYVEGGFGYGESEYEVSFGLAPRNGELSLSDPETPEPFNLAHIIVHPEIKGQWLSLIFLDFRGGKIGIF